MTTKPEILSATNSEDSLAKLLSAFRVVAMPETRQRLFQHLATALLQRDLLALEVLETILRQGGTLQFPITEGLVVFWREVLPKFPTIAKGMAALGMKSMVEWYFDDNIRFQQTEYTHYLQRPYFFFPGIRAKAVWDTHDFDWVPQLEASFPDIREEYASVLKTYHRQRAEQVPFGQLALDQGLLTDSQIREILLLQQQTRELFGEISIELEFLDKEHVDEIVLRQKKALDMEGSTYAGPDAYDNLVEGWSSIVFQRPKPNPRVQEMFPVTWKAMSSVPRFNKSAVAMFSRLQPGTTLAPHYGPKNGTLRVHLCIEDSPHTYIRIGEEIIDWQEGKVIIFDDSFEHQVAHRGDRPRTVLFFDVWHPDWLDSEVRLLNRETHWDLFIEKPL